MYEKATNKEVPNNANPSKRKILLATSNLTKKTKNNTLWVYFSLSWWTLVRKVRTIIQADILDSLGRKEASML